MFSLETQTQPLQSRHCNLTPVFCRYPLALTCNYFHAKWDERLAFLFLIYHSSTRHIFLLALTTLM